MKFKLRSLFALTIIAAVLSVWLAKRQVRTVPGALLQVVPQPATSIDSFVDDFYTALLVRLEPKELVCLRDNPQKAIRKHLQFEIVSKDSNSKLVVLGTSGNPLLDDQEELKIIQREAVQLLDQVPPQNLHVKWLNLPKL